jgi:TonB-linked SusC/RagA family outer membrane protein
MERRIHPVLMFASVLALSLGISSAVQAQAATITGRVVTNAGPLENASVLVPGTAAGARTDAQGNYRFTTTATDGQQVVVLARAVGYKPVRATVTIANRQASANFTLERDVLNLDQIVVTGTSDAISTRKTGFSVAVVDASQLKEVPATTPLGGLNGRVAGATVQASSGTPGSAPVIRLRGATSLTGRQDPLIIIDGTISRISLADVNSEDIDRIEVIKGAAASSLYGSDAANGVVQIFTKSGRQLAEGRSEITVRNEFGQNAIRRSIPNNLSHAFQLNADGSFKLSPSGNRIPETDGISDNPYPTYFDQLGQVYRPATFMTNYVSVGQRRGGSSMNASFQNTRDQGILNLLDGFSRQNFRVNATMAVNDRFDLQTGAFLGTSTADQPDESNVFFGLRMLEPNIDLTATVDGIPYNPKVRQSGRTGNVSNPLYSAANQDNQVTRTRFTGFARGTFRLRDWLTLEGNANFDTGDERSKFFVPLGFLNSTGNTSDGSLFQAESETRAYNLGMSATSVRRFGDLTNTSKVAWVYEDQTNRRLSAFAPALAVPRVPEFSGAKRDPDNPVIPGSLTQDIRNNNVFLISTLDWKEKLILDGLVRRDQSSLFGADQRSAIYGRGSVAYRLTEDVKLPGIQELKLRGSIGTAGLRPVYDAQYEQFALVSGNPVKVTLGNPNLRPAQSREVEVGLNVDFLDRFTFEYSYSDKLTTDQILNAPVSAVAGFQNQWINAGSLKAYSHEALLGAVLAQSKDFFWRLNVTMDRTRQTVETLNVAPFLVGPDPNDANTAIFRIAPGETFGVIYGSRWIRTQDQLQTTIDAGGLSGTPDDYVQNEEGYYVAKSVWQKAGERPLKYMNADGETIMQIGDVNPDFNLAFNTQATWKGLSISAVVNWVNGGNIYNYTRQWPIFDLRDPVIDQRGKPEAEKKNVAYYSAFYNNFDPSDYFIEDGSFVRLRELAVNYTLPSTLLARTGLANRSVRLGIVGRNLLTWTNYSGYDPEVSGPGGGNPFAYRVDYFTYPVFRTVTAMVEVGF